MDTCSLYMFHDTRNQDIFAIAYGIDLNFLALQIFIYQDWMILCDTVNNTNKFIHIVIINCNLHTLSAKYVRRSYQNRISQTVRNFFCFLRCKYSTAGRSWNFTLLKDLIEELSILCCIYVLSRCTKDRHAHLHQRLCQLDRCLSAKLYYCSVRFFKIYNAFYIFRCQRLKIQLVCNIKVCTYRLRVIIYDNCFIAFFCKCPGTVYRTEVKFNTLTDTDRTRTKYQNLLTVIRLCHFIFTVIYRIVIWSLCRELCRTGIYHLICCSNTILMTHVMNLTLSVSCNLSNHIIRELHTFRFTKQILIQCAALHLKLYLYQMCNLVDKPFINLGHSVNLIIADTLTNCFCDLPDTSVIYNLQYFQKFLSCQIRIIIRHQTVHMLLQRTNSFHQRSFKVITDTHNLSGSFHLSCQCSLGTDKFIKWQTRDLNYTVVQHRLKTCISLLSNCVLDLIKRVTECNFSSNLSNRISSCLRCQRRRTAHTRVNLDYTVFECIRMQRILHITSTGNIQFTDDIQCRCTQHLILFITQCLRRCYYDTISGMYTNRINIFHITYSNAVTIAVTHYLVLDLFPSCDASLYQYLTNTRQAKSVFQNFHQLYSVVSDTAATSAQCISRS